jgi:radical SAM superfamily enzyme YgiQ (UPF0313 family)
MRVLWPIYKLETEHNQYPGVMTISALLKREGFRSDVVPARVADITDRLREEPRSILAFSAVTPLSSHLLEINREVRRVFPEITTVLGGPHPTYYPDTIDEEGVDALCVGEGEYAMLEFVRALDGGRSVTSIPNWWVKRDGRVHRNEIRPLIDDLDELPIPDHAAFRKARARRATEAVVITSRGCPHGCTYCHNHLYRKMYAGKGRLLRRRSVNHVIQELRVIKDEGYRFVRFMDDLFILSPDWVEEFAERYRREVALPFSCLVRPNLVTERTMESLRRAGCHRVMMGVEAGDDRLRTEVLKRRMTSEQILEAARTVRESGLRLVTANILGIPGGSFEADWETLDLNLRARPHYASVSLMQAYPGTEIHEYAKGLGIVEADQMERVSRARAFGFTSELRFSDPREKRRVENLHKLFPWVVWLPFLAPLARRLVEVRPNRFFDFLYLVSLNLGSSLIMVPPRIGAAILWRKVLDRLRARGGSVEPTRPETT